MKKKVNPFGDAKPREVNLQSRFHEINHPSVNVPYSPPCGDNESKSAIPERDRSTANTNTFSMTTTQASSSNEPPLPKTTTTSPNKVTKVNPFGNAKPREQNLAKRGIDVKLLDESIEIKASTHSFTPQ
jgi:hypothetical protein